MTDTKQAEIQILLKLIEEKTGYTLDDLKSLNRKRELVLVRRAFFAIARKLLELSFKKIGDVIGQDHTTVMYSLTKHNEEIDVFDEYTKVYHNIHGSLSILYVARTEYNEEYMLNQIDLLKTQKGLIDDRIKEYRNKIGKLNGGKNNEKIA